MADRHVELLAVGAGPSNLALSVALEELAPELAEETLLVEQHDDVVWQRGMLLPSTVSQVSFLKDLVTLRNPRSKFSFVNYLHDVGRLNEFVNLGSFTPYRLEISQYLRWVAESLSSIRVEYGRRCVRIEPMWDADRVTGWRVGFGDGSTVTCRALALGTGRDPHVPEIFAGLPPQRVIHSTEYTWRVRQLDAAQAHRVVVIGGAQSAAEMLWDAHQSLPNAECTMVMRSIGLSAYQTSRFTNELYYPSFVDEFYGARPAARQQVLDDMHNTNYGGLAPNLLETLYRQTYLERLSGRRRLRMITMTDVTGVSVDDDVVLTLTDRKTGRSQELRCDVVLLGTGFDRRMPRLIRDLSRAAGMDEVEVTRNYRLVLPEGSPAACYLQGVNEATHGISDSLLSVLASRAEDVVSDMLTHRPARELVSTAA